MKYKETGAYAYEAYAAAVNYRNYQGAVMPQWPELPEEIKNAWRQAAHAAIKYGWQGKDHHKHEGGSPGEATRTSHRVLG